MSDYTPVNADATMITLTAGATITGGLLVSVTTAGDTVVHSTTNVGRPVGVAAHDAPSGGRVSVYLLPGFLHELPVETVITLNPGDGVIATTVTTTPGRVASVAFTTTNLSVFGVCVRGTVGTAAGAKARVLGL